MNIRLLTFAAMKDYFSADTAMTLDSEYTVEDLKQTLKSQNPSASELIDSCRFAVNQVFVDDKFDLFEGAVVAILPPSSGG